MATRAIVTSQPEVACDICARRLLRGEQPETFVADGRPCVVCELCTPRARSAGWVHVSEAAVVGKRPEDRPTGSASLRSLVRRWRGPSRERRPERAGAGDPLEAPAPDAIGDGHIDAGALGAREELWAYDDAALGSAAESGAASRPVPEPAAPGSGESADVAPSGALGHDTMPVPARPRGAAGEDLELSAGPADGSTAGAPLADGAAQAEPRPVPAAPGREGLLAEAVAIFNATDGPQRIAGVARSLGAPVVTVRERSEALPDGSAAGLRIAIVAAWELCWYRWEVDLGGVAVDAPLVAQGSELEELPAADLAGNASVDRRGSVHLG